MSRLANISGKDAVKKFQKLGYTIDRQTGSHQILIHDSRATLSVPQHKELAPGLLRGLIRESGLTPDEFFKQGHS